MEWPWTRASDQKVGQRSEDGRFNKPSPGIFVGVIENGKVALSVLENAQRSLCDAI